MAQNNQCELTLVDKPVGDEKMKHSEIKHPQTHMKCPYKCDQCDKTFSYKVVLKRHYMIHTDERPHKRDQCGKAFRFKVDLRRHYLLHMGKRPYQCDKSFIQKSHVNNHHLIHTAKKPCQCDMCKKRFRQQIALKNII